MDEEILRRLRLLKDTKPVLFSVVRRVSLDNPWIKVKGARDLNVLISNRNYFLEKGVFILVKVRYLAGLIIILLCTWMVGCSSSNEPAGDNQQPPGQNQTEPTDNNESEDIITDSGNFTGRIDSLSIEIHISGVPEDNENAYRAFELSEQLREDFDALGIETGDQVIFKYKPGSEGRRGVIMEINKHEN
jgi:hypothetical protein